MDEQARTMSLCFYYADCKQKFKEWDNKKLKELADEISEISMYFPIYEPSHFFKEGTFANAFKDTKLKYLTATKDNTFKIAGMGNEFTTLHLMALLNYCVNRLSGGQLTDRFEYVKLGEMI